MSLFHHATAHPIVYWKNNVYIFTLIVVQYPVYVFTHVYLIRSYTLRGSLVEKTPNYSILSRKWLMFLIILSINQSKLRTYTKVVPFKEKNSLHFVVLWQILNGMEWLKLIIEAKYIRIKLSRNLMDLVGWPINTEFLGGWSYF